MGDLSTQWLRTSQTSSSGSQLLIVRHEYCTGSGNANHFNCLSEEFSVLFLGRRIGWLSDNRGTSIHLPQTAWLSPHSVPLSPATSSGSSRGFLTYHLVIHINPPVCSRLFPEVSSYSEVSRRRPYHTPYPPQVALIDAAEQLLYSTSLILAACICDVIPPLTTARNLRCMEIDW